MNKLILIEQRNKRKILSQKINPFILMISIIIFITGTISVFNKNEVILFYSQISIIIILLNVSYLEYKYRKIENKLLSYIKEYTSLTYNINIHKKMNSLNKKRIYIDKLSLILLSISSLFLIISLLSKYFYQINIFKLTTDISIICFFILSFNEWNYSKNLTSLIDSYLEISIKEEKIL